MHVPEAIVPPIGAVVRHHGCVATVAVGDADIRSASSLVRCQIDCSSGCGPVSVSTFRPTRVRLPAKHSKGIGSSLAHPQALVLEAADEGLDRAGVPDAA